MGRPGYWHCPECDDQIRCGDEEKKRFQHMGMCWTCHEEDEEQKKIYGPFTDEEANEGLAEDLDSIRRGGAGFSGLDD